MTENNPSTMKHSTSETEAPGKGPGMSVLAPVLQALGRAYPALTVLARFPFAMVVVGVLTLVVAARDSLELGGITSAMVGLGMVCFGPLIGAAADRFGHRPTILIVAAINSALLAVTVWVVYSPAPGWAVMLVCFFIGATVPQTSPISRTRVVGSINLHVAAPSRPRATTTALAFESVADEVSFVLGPVVVGLLATAFSPWAPLIGAATLTLVFVTAFALHHTASSTADRVDRALNLDPVSHLLRPRLLVVVLGSFGAGLGFGAMLTGLIAFMQDRGMVDQAGLIYGCMAFSSGICAIAITWLPESFSHRARWLTFSAVTAIGTLLFINISSVPQAAIALAVMGAGIGPLLVTLFNLGATRTPQGRSATVMTMVNTGIMIGQAVAGAAVGLIAESHGTEVVLFGPLVAVCVTFTAGLINAMLTPRRRGE